MPILPGEPFRGTSPDKLWSLYERGLLSGPGVVLEFIDDLADDVGPFVQALPMPFRNLITEYLRDTPLAEIPPVFLIGPGLSPADSLRSQRYRQQKAKAIGAVLGLRIRSGEG